MSESTLYHDTCHHRIYYLTCDEFDALWKRSKGCCEICGVAETDTKTGRLHIDHHNAADHLVRGMLCERCNAFMRFVDEGRHAYINAETTRYLWRPFHARFRRPGVPIKSTRAWQAKHSKASGRTINELEEES